MVNYGMFGMPNVGP